MVTKAASVDDATAAVTRIAAEVDSEWQLACSLWEDRWQQAFQPGNAHYSGWLPVLSTDDPGLDRVYYFGTLMLVALERTNLGLWPRVYTISQGNPNSIIGAADMGGSGQFTWDLTFTANVLSLLDPEATKEILKFIIASTNLAMPFPGWDQPWLVPQSWDGNSAGLGPNATYSGGSEYRFDYYAAFVFVSTYIRVTNDTAFLSEEIKDHTAGPPSTVPCLLSGNWSDGAAADPPVVVRQEGRAVEVTWEGAWHFANGTTWRDEKGHTFVKLQLRHNATSKIIQNMTAVLRDVSSQATCRCSRPMLDRLLVMAGLRPALMGQQLSVAAGRELAATEAQCHCPGLPEGAGVLSQAVQRDSGTSTLDGFWRRQAILSGNGADVYSRIAFPSVWEGVHAVQPAGADAGAGNKCRSRGRGDDTRGGRDDV